MKKNSQRLLALILTVMFIVSMLPSAMFTVHADPVSDYVVNNYDDLVLAIEEANGDYKTIEITADIDISDMPVFEIPANIAIVTENHSYLMLSGSTTLTINGIVIANINSTGKVIVNGELSTPDSYASIFSGVMEVYGKISGPYQVNTAYLQKIFLDKDADYGDVIFKNYNTGVTIALSEFGEDIDGNLVYPSPVSPIKLNVRLAEPTEDGLELNPAKNQDKIDYNLIDLGNNTYKLEIEATAELDSFQAYSAPGVPSSNGKTFGLLFGIEGVEDIADLAAHRSWRDANWKFYDDPDEWGDSMGSGSLLGSGDEPKEIAMWFYATMDTGDWNGQILSITYKENIVGGLVDNSDYVVQIILSFKDYVAPVYECLLLDKDGDEIPEELNIVEEDVVDVNVVLLKDGEVVPGYGCNTATDNDEGAIAFAPKATNWFKITAVKEGAATIYFTFSDGTLYENTLTLNVEVSAKDIKLLCDCVCTECGGCLEDDTCDCDCECTLCDGVCEGHTPPPPTTCDCVCPTCGGCLEDTCDCDCECTLCDGVCEGHTPPPTCDCVCPTCGGCLEDTCDCDCECTLCDGVCEGHTPPPTCTCEPSDCGVTGHCVKGCTCDCGDCYPCDCVICTCVPSDCGVTGHCVKGCTCDCDDCNPCDCEEVVIPDGFVKVKISVVGEGEVVAIVDGEEIFDGAILANDDIIDFTATAGDGYRIKYWIVNGTAYGNPFYTGSIFGIRAFYGGQALDMVVVFEYIETPVTFSVAAGTGSIIAEIGEYDVNVFVAEDDVLSGDMVETGALLQFTAAPADKIVQWKVNGVVYKQWNVVTEQMEVYTGNILQIYMTEFLNVTVSFVEDVIPPKPPVVIGPVPGPYGTQESTTSPAPEVKEEAAVDAVVVNGVKMPKDLTGFYAGGLVNFSCYPGYEDGLMKDTTFVIPVSVLEAAKKATEGKFNFGLDTPAGKIVIPSDFMSLIVGDTTDAVSVKVTISEVAKGVVGFKIELLDKDGKVLSEVKLLKKAILKIIYLANDTVIPEFWGVYIDGVLTFVPAKVIVETSAGKLPKKRVEIWSATNSTYEIRAYAPTFTDVNAKDWFYKDVTTAAAKGLVNGRSASTFDPANSVSRAEFIAMIVRALRLPAVKDDKSMLSPFSDVTAADWFYNDVIKANAIGLFDLLIDDGALKPKEAITREEMAYIVAQAAAYVKVPVTLMAALWTDADQIDSQFTSAVDTVFNLGIIKGRSAGVFAPKGLMTRAEAATVLVRMCSRFGWID